MDKKYMSILIIFILVFINVNVLSLSDTNYDFLKDPSDIRISSDLFELEWPEYGLPPIPPNIPSDGKIKSNNLDDDLPKDISILEWQEEFGSFDKYQKQREDTKIYINEISSCIKTRTNPLIIIFINSNIQPYISNEITNYSQTLINNGYSTVIISISGGEAIDLKNQILNYYNSGYNVAGAVLFGSLPVAWFYHEWDFHGPDVFPCDLFLMDLDGEWIDSDNDDIYDIHTDGSGDTSPEIFVGRIDASDFNSDEVSVTNDYLQKVDDYWTGAINHTDYGLTYTEMDWNASDDIRFSMGYAYDTYEPVYYPYVNRDDYVFNRIPDTTYEFIQLACHSWSGGHAFTDGGSASSDDIRNAPPNALFYNLFCCGALRFTDENCLGNAYILDTNSPSLSVLGSTKSGSMLNFNDFYQAIGDCCSFGEAFKIWFEDQYPYSDDPGGYNEVSWYYGMIILGDPTLIPQLTSTDYLTHDIITIYNDGTDDLVISDINIYYNSSEPIGWLDVNPKSLTVKSSNPRYVTITADPNNLTSGSYHSWLHIYSNDPDENPYNVSVTLKVIGEDIAITQINSPTGNLLPGYFEVNATIKNCGTEDLYDIGVDCNIYQTSLCEGFESYPYVPPYTWTTVNPGWSDSLFGASHSGSHWAYAWGGDYNPDCWLITKKISVPTDADLSFWYRIESENYPAAFEVGISTSDDTTNISDFVILWDSGMYNHDEYIQQIVDLSSYEGADVYIGFHHYDSTDNMWGILIDDVSIIPYNLLDSLSLSVSSLFSFESQFIEFPSVDLTQNADYIINVSLQQDDERTFNNYQETYVHIGNIPPTTPQIKGETYGKTGTSYDYTFKSIDPEDLMVKYFIDWGDEETEWTSFSPSGDTVTVSHVWEEEGTYIVKSKAQDEFGLESPMGSLEVVMPVNKLVRSYNSPLFELFKDRFPILYGLITKIVGFLIT